MAKTDLQWQGEEGSCLRFQVAKLPKSSGQRLPNVAAKRSCLINVDGKGWGPFTLAVAGQVQKHFRSCLHNIPSFPPPFPLPTLLPSTDRTFELSFDHSATKQLLNNHLLYLRLYSSSNFFFLYTFCPALETFPIFTGMFDRSYSLFNPAGSTKGLGRQRPGLSYAQASDDSALHRPSPNQLT